MSASWATLMGGMRYGYAPVRIVRIEGIPVLFVDVISDGLGGDGYTLDASLITDGGARLGPVMSDKDGIGSANDFEFGLLATEAVSALMAEPTAQTVTTQDFAHDDTEMHVLGTDGFRSNGYLFFGTSVLERNGYLWTSFPGLDRGVYGPPRTYPAGTMVTDVPVQWENRRVDAFYGMLDPGGRWVATAGDTVLSQATCFFSGYLAERPIKNGAMWSFVATDQIERLRLPLSAAASGTARWSLDDDAALYVDRNLVVSLVVHGDVSPDVSGGHGFVDVSVRPFSAEPAGPILKSRIRHLIKTSLLAAASGTGLDSLEWVQSAAPNNGDLAREWTLSAKFAGPTDTILKYRINADPNPNLSGLTLRANLLDLSIAYPGDYQPVPLFLVQSSSITGGALAITIDDGDPSTIPAAGFVRLEGGGAKQVLEYASRTTDTADGATVHLQLVAGSRPLASELRDLASAEVGDAAAEVTATFLWRDSGPVPDILRRAIVSTGDGTNGTWDTLARGQGYGIEAIDEDSFDVVFDGAFLGLAPVLAVDSGASLAKLMGGLLRLSQRGLASRRRADGSTVEVAAVNLGPCDTFQVVATIRDSDLAMSDRSTKPIRVIDRFTAPQTIEVVCKTAEIGDQAGSDGVLIENDKSIAGRSKAAWKVDVYGVDRSILLLPVHAWAQSWFLSCRRQRVEIDLPPWGVASSGQSPVAIQVGDCVLVDSEDTELWDYSLTSSGYHGLGRVEGVKGSTETLIQTTIVSLDGLRTATPMAPSIPILAVNGPPTNPTSVDVDPAYYDLIYDNRGSPWWLLVYCPGEDDGAGAFTTTGPTLTGGVCRISVLSAPSITRTWTTSDRLTWPVAAVCTTGQGRYLQNTDRTQWS